jgi:competence protein ComEC
MATASPDSADTEPRPRARDQLFGTALAWLARNAAEERDRWTLWIPVFIGAGIAAYFGLGAEPPAWSGMLGLAVAVAARIALQRRPLAAMAMTCLALAFLGFSAAQFRVAVVAAPFLQRESGGAVVEGRICQVALLPSGYRVHLDHLSIAGMVPEDTPERIRLRVHGASAEDHAGGWVQLAARLGPISAPVAPGAFDFQRDVYFDRIGAVGFAFGAPQPIAPRRELGWLAALPCQLSVLRLEIARRIRAILPGDVGAISVALITGDQGAISRPTMQNMRDSGLVHLLSISGLHIGLVAGILFVAVRRLLCLVPRVALHYPIKKWGAAAALLGTLFYMVLAGAPVPTVRAYIMAGMFLLAVLLDRTAISMPPVAWAAVVVLLVRPEELIGPSFQMSFAAVVCLVAAYEGTQAVRLHWRAGSGWGGRAGLYVAALILTSLVATLATAPYSIYHFNRIANYGVVANMLAVPLTGVWVMPCAVLAVVLMPFGLEHLALIPMGWGVDVITVIAEQVAGRPEAAYVVPLLPTAGLAAVTLGGLWLCLWQRPWRVAGLPVMLLGMATIAFARSPDILVAENGRFFAVADPAGGLLLSTPNADDFVADTWSRRSGADAVGSFPADGYGAGGRLACDSLGCIYKAFGRTIALVQQPVALFEDCGMADVVVSLEPVRVPCPATTAVIDRFDLWRNGAHAIWIAADGEIDIRSVREMRGDRPWVVRPQPRD